MSNVWTLRLKCDIWCVLKTNNSLTFSACSTFQCCDFQIRDVFLLWWLPDPAFFESAILNERMSYPKSNLWCLSCCVINGTFSFLALILFLNFNNFSDCFKLTCPTYFSMNFMVISNCQTYYSQTKKNNSLTTHVFISSKNSCSLFHIHSQIKI